MINIGCQGRGVGLETAMGAALAPLGGDRRTQRPAFPVVPMRPIPFHALQELYVSAVVGWFRLLDAARL